MRRAACNAGSNRAIKILMVIFTTSNSTKVNALLRGSLMGVLLATVTAVPLSALEADWFRLEHHLDLCSFLELSSQRDKDEVVGDDGLELGALDNLHVLHAVREEGGKGPVRPGTVFVSFNCKGVEVVFY